MWEMDSKQDELMKDQIYEGYQVIEILGSGTFGKVYKVKDIKTNQILAMKYVHQNKKYKNRESQIMQMIDSNYVVKLYNNFYKQQKNFNSVPMKTVYLNLVMEYMPETLSKIIKQNFPYKKYLPTQTIIKYTRCLITALRDIHAINICHRDLKPSNILVNENEAKLCDFGSAKVLMNGQKNIAYICSRYYRAPQLLFGAIYYSSQVDIWSLGCVIAEMMTNRSLFQGPDSTAMLSRIIQIIGSPSQQDLKGMKLDESEVQIDAIQRIGLANRLKKMNPDCDGRLIDLVQKMVVFDPNNRITAEQALKLPLFK